MVSQEGGRPQDSEGRAGMVGVGRNLGRAGIGLGRTCQMEGTT